MRGSSLFLSFLSLILLGLALSAALGGWGIYKYLAPGPAAEERMVLIERGTGVSGIAAQLKDAGVIESALIFKIAARLKDGSLKAGEYAFPAHIPMAQAAQMMRDGQVYDRKFTIPEGLTSYQIVQIVNKIDVLEGTLADIPEEGSLLPETYHYVKGDTKDVKIAEMKAAMEKAIGELWDARQADH